MVSNSLSLLKVPTYLNNTYTMSNPNTHETLHLPIIDISKPLTPNSLSSLSQACMEWGFFHITNHGIPNDLFKRLYTLSNQAFKLPTETKIKLGPSTPTNTYTPHYIASPFFESLRVSGPGYYASAKSSADILFGSSPPNAEFCDILQEYGAKMMELSKTISTVLLKCLGDNLESKYYESEFSQCHGYLRINNYSAPESDMLEEVEGLGMHTDMSCLTILFLDDVGGLQVRSKEGDQWMEVLPREGTMVVNVGDLFQAWSNGRLRSSKHRVVLKRPVTRFSMAFFWCFEDEKLVMAPDDVVGEGVEKVYKPFVCKEYMKFRENSEIGRFDKVGFTVHDFTK